MESMLALLLALASVPFQLSRGKQGCGEGSRLQETNGYKGGDSFRECYGNPLHGFERLGRCGSGCSLIKTQEPGPEV